MPTLATYPNIPGSRADVGRTGVSASLSIALTPESASLQVPETVRMRVSRSV